MKYTNSTHNDVHKLCCPNGVTGPPIPVHMQGRDWWRRTGPHPLSRCRAGIGGEAQTTGYHLRPIVCVWIKKTIEGGGQMSFQVWNRTTTR